MGIFTIFRKSWVVLSVILLLACGGGGGDDAPPPPAPTPNISAQSTVDLGGVVLGNSVEQLIEITNTGNLNLKINQISPLNAPYEIVSTTDNCSNATLAPNTTCSLRIKFLPAAQGSFSATLAIPSNDPDTSIKNIRLNGEGYGLNVWISKVVASCPTVSFDVTVADPDNLLPLSSLIKNNFKLYENNIELQDFVVSPWTGLSPASVVLALDASGSMSSILPTVQTEASNFINQLQAGDYAAVCKMGYAASIMKSYPVASPFLIETTPTGKTDLINNGINMTFGPFGPGQDTSALYDSLMLAIDRAATAGTFPSKKALVIVSDGVDNASVATSLNQVIAYAKQKGVKIFSIYYISPSLVKEAKPQVMVRLANETGGQYFDTTTIGIATAFQQLENVITNSYTITYTSSACSGTISVRADSGGLYGADSTTFP